MTFRYLRVIGVKINIFNVKGFFSFVDNFLSKVKIYCIILCHLVVDIFTSL